MSNTVTVTPKALVATAWAFLLFLSFIGDYFFVEEQARLKRIEKSLGLPPCNLVFLAPARCKEPKP